MTTPLRFAVLLVLPLAAFSYHVMLSLFRLSTYEITNALESIIISNSVILCTLLLFIWRNSEDWRWQVH